MGKRFKQGINPGKLHILCGLDSPLCYQTLQSTLLGVSKGDSELPTTNMASTWKENDLIFTSSIGTPMDQHNLYHTYREFIHFVGLPEIRFHDLRHYVKLKVMGSVCDLTGKMAGISGKHFP